MLAVDTARLGQSVFFCPSRCQHITTLLATWQQPSEARGDVFAWFLWASSRQAWCSAIPYFGLSGTLTCTYRNTGMFTQHTTINIQGASNGVDALRRAEVGAKKLNRELT
jgi:hypothetical protein